MKCFCCQIKSRGHGPSGKFTLCFSKGKILKSLTIKTINHIIQHTRSSSGHKSFYLSASMLISFFTLFTYLKISVIVPKTSFGGILCYVTKSSPGGGQLVRALSCDSLLHILGEAQPFAIQV